jgi:phage gp29-like protein
MEDTSTTPALVEPDPPTGDPYVDISKLGHYDKLKALSMQFPGYNSDIFIQSKGYKSLEEMLGMGAVKAPLDLVRSAVLYKGWTVLSAVKMPNDSEFVKAKEIAECFQHCLENIEDEYGNTYDFRNDLMELLASIHFGFRVSEIHWRMIERGKFEGKMGFSMFAHKPCRQIGFLVNPDTMAVRYLSSRDGYGATRFAPNEKILRYTYNGQDSLPYGSAVGRQAYKHYWSLNFQYTIWNVALEIYGSPFLLTKAPINLIPIARAVISEIRQGAPGVLPEGVEHDLVESSGASIQSFKVATDTHRDAITHCYQKETLSSQQGQRTGSMALGKVHADTREYALTDSRRDLEFILYVLSKRFTRINYGPEMEHLAPRVSLGDWDDEDFAKLADGFTKLTSSKILHPFESCIRERMNLPPIDPKLEAELTERLNNEGVVSQTAKPEPNNENDDPAPNNQDDNTDD